MRARLLTLVGLAAVALAVVLSLRSEERFVVEGARLEPEAGGVRVAGTIHNTGAAAAQVAIEIAVVSAEGRLSEKEKVTLAKVAAGERVGFSSRLYPQSIR